jgi:hypothetical protein
MNAFGLISRSPTKHNTNKIPKQQKLKRQQKKKKEKEKKNHLHFFSFLSFTFFYHCSLSIGHLWFR